MNFFKLSDDECFEQRCGEIFLTSKGNITIHCTLCDVIYKSFDAYSNHLYKQHLNSVEEKEQNNLTGDGINLEAEDIVSTVKVELDTSENEILKEEELPFDELLEVSKANENEEKDFLSNFENTNNLEEIECQELGIPKVFRNVNKRTLSKQATAPAEERKHKCPICGLAFKGKHNMNYHLRRHSTEKNHECSECDKKFHTTTEVRIHMRSHIYGRAASGKKEKKKQTPVEKNQDCLECRKNFHSPKKDRTQFHTCERTFLCSHCGRSFLRNSHLSRHIKTHTNQRDFKCQICEKAFYESDTLKRHMRGHSSERPFACKVCPATFSRLTALRNHEKLHENKREYKCNLCGSGFNQQAGLFSHMKVAHK